jgi:hypothetical protein
LSPIPARALSDVTLWYVPVARYGSVRGSFLVKRVAFARTRPIRRRPETRRIVKFLPSQLAYILNELDNGETKRNLAALGRFAALLAGSVVVFSVSSILG